MSDLIRGNQLLRSGQLEEAIAAYQSAIARNPSFHWSYYQLGEALEQVGRWEEAIAAYQKAVELNPEASRAHLKSIALELNPKANKSYLKLIQLILQKQYPKVKEANSLKDQLEFIDLFPAPRSEAINTNNMNVLFAQNLDEKYVFKFNIEAAQKVSENNMIESACVVLGSPHRGSQILIQNTYTYNSFPVYLARFSWSLICFPKPFIIFNFSKYWQDVRHPDPARTKPYAILKTEKGKKLKTTEVTCKRVINEITILLAIWTYPNYYHWHINILPAIFSLKNKINSGKFRVMSYKFKDWQKISIQKLGIDLSIIEEIAEPETILFRSMICGSTIGHIGRGLPPYLKSVFGFLRNSHWKNTKKTINEDRSPEFIFISRQDTNRRKLLNEAEVYEALRSKGFVKVVPGYLSYEQQIETFARAKIIVAQHGAGLTNMGFAPPGCHVVEIFPGHMVVECYWRLAQILGHKYAYIIAQVTEEAFYAVSDKNAVRFSVSVDAVLHAISYIIHHQSSKS